MIRDEAEGATSKHTTVNGNSIHTWAFSNGNEYNATARRVAAALPRDMDGLNFIDATADGANLHFEAYDGPTSKMWDFSAPRGYQIAEVGQYHDGDLCITVEVADD